MMMHMNGRASASNWFRLFRLTNLLIIILTQILVWLFIIKPLYNSQGIELQLSPFDFILLLMATVLIAAGGYIVNDIYDIDVDDFNKRPNIIGRKLSVNSAWTIYFVLNIIAFIAGFYLALQAGSLQLGFIFAVIAGMLYLYSSRYQNKLLWGNLIVAFSTAMVLLLVWLFEFMYLRNNPDAFLNALDIMPVISRFVWSFTLFAFLVSLIREFIKDVQDIDGDKRFGSYTMAISLGIPVMKTIVSIGIIIGIILLAIAQYFLLQNGYRYAFWYLILTVQMMLIYLLITILRARNSKDFYWPSLLAKFILLAGVLSIQLIYLDLS